MHEDTAFKYEMDCIVIQQRQLSQIIITIN